MSQHIHAHEHPESETDRGGGFTIWFTGLSGSGKTTIAHHLGPELDRRRLVREPDDDDAVHGWTTPSLVQNAATTNPPTAITNPTTESHAIRRPCQPRKPRATKRTV